jgi:hypothetical protein
MESLGWNGSIQPNVGREKKNSLQPKFMEFSSVSQSSWISTSFADDLDTHPRTSDISCRPAQNIDLNLEPGQAFFIVFDIIIALLTQVFEILYHFSFLLHYIFYSI